MTSYYDLHRMVMTGGRERSPSDFDALFRQAGSELMRVVTAPDLLTTALVEARPI